MGRPKQFVVSLSEEERQQLKDMTRKGMISARVMTRAQVLLLTDRNYSAREVRHENVTLEQANHKKSKAESSLVCKPVSIPP